MAGERENGRARGTHARGVPTTSKHLLRRLVWFTIWEGYNNGMKVYEDCDSIVFRWHENFE